MEGFNKDRASEPGHPEFDHIIENSLPLELVLAEVERVAPTDSTVLVLGKTGTNRQCHSSSKRALRTSVREAELRGHSL